MEIEQECQICFESISLPTNKIISCMECGVSCHYKCYGNIETNYDTNINNWYCDVCLFKQYHNIKYIHQLNIKCSLCPNIEPKFSM